MHKCVVATMAVLLASGVTTSGMITAEEGQRRQAALARLDADLTTASAADQKLAIVQQAMKDEVSPDMRRQILSRAELLKSTGLEDWLIGRLRDEPDCMVRGEVASLLGKKGSLKAVEPLITTAKSDVKTFGEIGCMRIEGTARRQAMFALAELGSQLPAQRQGIIEALRSLPARDDKTDSESLYDVRLQSLYQLTGDKEFLTIFFERLASKDSKERMRGVVAFRFFKLSKAPQELVALLEDPEQEVRSWTALVLGEIGDRGAAPALMAAAENAKFDLGTRANAIVSLKNMKAKAALPLMKRLSTDPDSTIAHWATAAMNTLQEVETRPTTASGPTE